MIINTALEIVALFVPFTGSAYKFVRTCVRIYNATSSTKALITEIKKIAIDCILFVIKYLLLCTGAITCGGATFITNDPNFIVEAL